MGGVFSPIGDRNLASCHNPGKRSAHFFDANNLLAGRNKSANACALRH
jgi:hypothetical protein